MIKNIWKYMEISIWTIIGLIMLLLAFIIATLTAVIWIPYLVYRYNFKKDGNDGKYKRTNIN